MTDPRVANKALVSILGAILTLLEVSGLVKIEDHEAVVTTLSSVLTPIVVYLIPNTKG